jgi:hypothetical protein
VFERKQTSNSEPNSTSWTILKWYWLLVPALFFLFVVPTWADGAEAPNLGLGDMYNFIFQLFNLSLAGILVQTDPLERSRSGAADGILKMAIGQQFISQNILGLILSGYTWYKLPYKVKPEMVTSEAAEKNYFKPKTLYILTAIVLILSILAIISQIFLN